MKNNSKNRRRVFKSSVERDQARREYIMPPPDSERKPHKISEQVFVTIRYNEDGSIEGCYLEGRKLRANIFEDFQSEEEKK